MLNIPNYDSDSDNTPEEMEMADLSSHEENRIGKVLICFSIYTNTKAIFSTKSDEELSVIHGLRFLSMVWIIMAHTILYTIDYLGK